MDSSDFQIKGSSIEIKKGNAWNPQKHTYIVKSGRSVCDIHILVYAVASDILLATSDDVTTVFYPTIRDVNEQMTFLI